jgi:hypothetical protein
MDRFAKEPAAVLAELHKGIAWTDDEATGSSRSPISLFSRRAHG